MTCLLLSCSGEKNEPEIIQNQDEVENTESLFSSKIDSVYLNHFKNGEFDVIIEKWNGSHKSDNDMDSILFKDFRMSIYYLSLFETTHDCDLEIVLNNYDTSCFLFVKEEFNRYIYFDCLLDDMGEYMMQTLLVYDFLNYKKYGMNNGKVMYAFGDVIDDKFSGFHLIEDYFRGHLTTESEYFNSLQTEYPYWLYLDSVEKYLSNAHDVEEFDW